MHSCEIPIIDASALGGTSKQKQDFAKHLLHEVQKHGIVKLIEHPIKDDETNKVLKGCQEFFHLPFAVRQRLSNDPKRGQQRGWSREGEEKTWWLESNNGTIAEPDFGDNKESFDHGPPSDEQFPNMWPTEEEQPGYQRRMEAFFAKCSDLMLELLESLATALNVPADTFRSRCSNAASTVRVNHFPPIALAKLDDGKTARIWPHYDFGIVSFVFPDVVGGLEYEDRATGGFRPVDFVKRNELLFLTAETLQRWTNGAVPACLHRVSKPRPREICDGVVPERTSIVFFCKADRHQDVGPLAPFATEERPARYENMTALEYQARRNAAHYP